MRKVFSWSQWSIGIKILVTFLGLFVISLGIIGYISLANIRELGNYAVQSSTLLGKTAILDSTAHLNKMGEDTITQVARDVAKQVEMYLNTRPPMTLSEMRNDAVLREIVVQPVGTTGYTTLLDSNNSLIAVHKYPEQEKSLTSLRETIPSFWQVLETSSGGRSSSGYYDWQEVDGTIRKKFASIEPIHYYGEGLTLWATTYIDEFSQPAEQTKKEINAAILNSSSYISDSVSSMQNTFIITFAILVSGVIGLALIIAWLITSPIIALKRGAEAIGQGELDYKIAVHSRDELGDLATSFNKMGSALKEHTQELQNTAAENIAKEKRHQENLRLYVQKVSEAQEAERKRIARELHDETAQSLVVILRDLDDLSSGNSRLSAKDIREEVRKVLEGVRRFSQELRPSILDDLGLIPALNWLTSDLTKNFGINVDFEVIGNQHQLPQETELMLFRIIQEALTNVRKHSKATKASVKVIYSERNVKVTVEDNGKGFKMPTGVGDLARLGKLGLAGMEERVQLLGGVLNIQSQVGKGTNVSVEIPV